MRKLFLILSVFALFSLVGCHKSDKAQGVNCAKAKPALEISVDKYK